MRRLETTVDLLDALQERHGWKSDNQVAKGLGIPQGTVSNWRRGYAYPTEVHALTIAKALDLGELGPLYVLAIAAADRSPDEKTRKTWLAQIARGLVVGFFVIGGGSTVCPPSAQAQVAESVYSGKSRKRRTADPLAA